MSSSDPAYWYGKAAAAQALQDVADARLAEVPDWMIEGVAMVCEQIADELVEPSGEPS